MGFYRAVGGEIVINRIEVLQRIKDLTTERFKIELRIGDRFLRQIVLPAFAEL
jgi:hypothetical protein